MTLLQDILQCALQSAVTPGLELSKEEAEAPMEVIASLWVGGIATLTLLSLIILQVSVLS